MFEKVNPSHPDKIADRIAGAIVDMAYNICDNPKIAVEVLIGHNECNIIIESNVDVNDLLIESAVHRISGIQDDIIIDIFKVKQDDHLAENQKDGIRCGDNGIFKGTIITREQQFLTNLVGKIYENYPYDGKYIIDNDKLIGCQSHITDYDLYNYLNCNGYKSVYNPLGFWSGGINVDCGATNRKLGSDMGDSITGGGLHGKDLSKADVAISIYCFLKAQSSFDDKPYMLSCAIGDDMVDGLPYSTIVEIAKEYIMSIGGFEKLAEWGLIRPNNN